MIDVLPAALVSRMITESLNAVIITDAEGTIRYMNPAMHALTGYAEGEAVGQSLDGLLPSGMVGHHQAHVERYLQAMTPSTVLGKVREFAIRHRTGEMIPIELKALDLGVSAGMRYFGAFMDDLRPRRLMEERNAALVAQLELQALTDPLTGLPNRRAFEAEGARAMARAHRGGGAITVGVADIDHFKRVNDTYGHPVGDAVLRAVTRRICNAARTTDIVARVGGEEFGMVFPETSLDKAVRVAERMRQAVAASPVTTEEGFQIKITISIGLAPMPDGMKLFDALGLGDAALYAAKRNGRNRVEVAPGPGAVDDAAFAAPPAAD